MHLQELVDKLIRNTQVLGLIEFGSRHLSEDTSEGDYDLLAILEQWDSPVTSLHFYADGVPVDLNFRTISKLCSLQTPFGFERALFRGQLIYDPTREIAMHLRRFGGQLSETSTGLLTEDEIARIRFWHKHVLDKIGWGRLASHPDFCQFLLNANVLWLLQNYFLIRQVEYRGPKAAFDHVEEHDPAVRGLIHQFYLTEDLEHRIRLTRELTDLVLEPIGGMWRDDERLAFGDKTIRELQQEGERMYTDLFDK